MEDKRGGGGIIIFFANFFLIAKLTLDLYDLLIVFFTFWFDNTEKNTEIYKVTNKYK